MRNGHRGFLLATFCFGVLTTAADVRADPITLTFEDLPESKMYDGGQENLGDFYTGATFGPAVFGGRAFGNTFIFAAGVSSLFIEFADPIGSFNVKYSSLDPLPLRFFDMSGAFLGSLTGAPTRPGDFDGHFDLLRFSATGIGRVTVHGADPGLFALDDVTYHPVPEPATLVMLGIGLSGLLWLRRWLSACGFAGSLR